MSVISVKHAYTCPRCGAVATLRTMIDEALLELGGPVKPEHRKAFIENEMATLERYAADDHRRFLGRVGCFFRRVGRALAAFWRWARPQL